MRERVYSLPDYQSVTSDMDKYLKAWRELAEPIEQAMGLTLSGFDPTFVFTKGNPQTKGTTTIELPVWFVRDLSNQLLAKRNNHV